LPNLSRFCAPKTGKESNVYGEMCTEYVPFRYLFSAKHTRNRPMIAAFVGSGGVPRRVGGRLPQLCAQGALALAGGGTRHLAARDAAEGAYAAKKWHFGLRGRWNISPMIYLGFEISKTSAVTGP
jgi:hypothetical protein